MENPALGGASECQLGGCDTRKFTRTPGHSQADPDRALAALSAALEMRPTPHPAEVALILRARLPPSVRLWLATSTVIALPAAEAEALARAVLADLRAHHLGAFEAERRRQIATYRKLSAKIRRPRP